MQSHPLSQNLLGTESEEREVTSALKTKKDQTEADVLAQVELHGQAKTPFLAQSLVQPLTQPLTQPFPQPGSQSLSQPLIQSLSQPGSQPLSQPLVQSPSPALSTALGQPIRSADGKTLFQVPPDVSLAETNQALPQVTGHAFANPLLAQKWDSALIPQLRGGAPLQAPEVLNELEPRLLQDSLQNKGLGVGGIAMTAGMSPSLFSEFQDSIQDMSSSSSSPSFSQMQGSDYVGLLNSMQNPSASGVKNEMRPLGSELPASLQPVRSLNRSAPLDPLSMMAGGTGSTVAFGSKENLSALSRRPKNLKEEAFSESMTKGMGEGVVGAGVLNQLGSNLSSSSLPEMNAQVTTGSQTKERMATDGLMQFSNEIKNFSMAGGTGGGEMKIRLKPDNFGELSVRVLTEGSRVGLKIQASDAKSKQILEESLHSLKESLAAQNLSLGQVEVTIASSSGSSDRSSGQSDTPSQFQQSQQEFSNLNDRGGRSNGDQRGSQPEWMDPDSLIGNRRNSIRGVASQAGLNGASMRNSLSKYANENGRLDVRG